MGVVVVTGSTRGIGHGLASAFLALEQQVVVSGRSRDAVDAAVERLSEVSEADRVHGVPCDVTDRDQVQALWDGAVARFGRVDIWINNAGTGHRSVPVVELTADEYAGVMALNVTGTLHGCTVAMAGMSAQDGGGAVWNMEGLGSDGRWIAGTTIYGASKYAVRFLTRALAREAEGGPVRVGAISPGMVVTDLLMRGIREGTPEERKRARKVFNILADRPETVTPWLARRVLASRGNGTRIAWLTTPKIAARFLLSPFRSRDLFDGASE